MQLVRERGNDYVHPKKTQTNKDLLLQRQRAARDVLSALIGLVEAIYLAGKSS
jgi:hypothetical protein